MPMGLKLGLNIGRQTGGGVVVPAYDPTPLYSGAIAGAFYDPSVVSSMWQDSARTTPAVVDQPVGCLDDRSGNANHALQATAGFRPILRSVGGLYWLEFDGVDDFLRVSFTIAQTWDRISGLRQISWTSTDRIFCGAGVQSGQLHQTGVSPNLALLSGGTNVPLTGSVGTDVVVTERHAGGTSQIASDADAYVTGNAGTTPTDGLTIANIDSVSALNRNANIRLYGVAMIGRALTSPETASLRTLFAAKQGRVL